MKKQEMDTQEKRKYFLLLDKNSFAASHSKSLLWTPKRETFLNTNFFQDFSGHLSCRTPENVCFCVDFF